MKLADALAELVIFARERAHPHWSPLLERETLANLRAIVSEAAGHVKGDDR